MKGANVGTFLLATVLLLVATTDSAWPISFDQFDCVTRCHRQYNDCKTKCNDDARCAATIDICLEFCAETGNMCVAQCEHIGRLH